MRNKNSIPHRAILIGLGVLAITLVVVAIGSINPVTALQATPTNVIFPIKATNDALIAMEQATARARETVGPVSTSTPDRGPTLTPNYGSGARVAGAGVIAGGGVQPSIWVRQYLVLSQWIETDGPDIQVFSGVLVDPSRKPTEQGAVLVVENSDFFHPQVYNTPQQDGTMEIIDAVGKQLILRSIKGQRFLYFDVGTRQFISALITPVADLRALLLNLNQQGKVDASAFTALDAHLRSAEDQLQQAHKTSAIAELNAFIDVAKAQSGPQNGQHLTSEAATQLIDLANKVIASLQ